MKYFEITGESCIYSFTDFLVPEKQMEKRLRQHVKGFKNYKKKLYYFRGNLHLPPEEKVFLRCSWRIHSENEVNEIKKRLAELKNRDI